jgi:hypothetical protein
MAKLSAHGTELARYERTDTDGTRTTWSIRSDGRVLYKSDWPSLNGRMGTGWKVAPVRVSADLYGRLARDGYHRVKGGR